MNNLFRLGACCLAALMLSGCNSLMATSYDTIKLAITGPEPLVSVEYVNTLARPGLVARMLQTEALLVRAAENSGIAEWHGLEQMLVTHNGRVVQAAGMPQEADLIAPLLPDDPFRGDLRMLDQTEVVRLVDYPDRFLTGIPQTARYQLGPREQIQVMGVDAQLQRLDEHISMPSIDFTATNYYWFVPATGKVIASTQHLAPGLPPMRLTEVCPAGFEE